MKRVTAYLRAAAGVFFILGITAAARAADNEEAAYREAAVWFNQGDWAKARDAFTRFLEQYPKSGWQPAVQLRLADLEPDTPKAVEQYRQVLRQWPKSEWAQDARWALAQTLFVGGDLKAALAELNSIGPESGGRHPHALYLAGLCQLQNRQYAEAKSSFDDVLSQYAASEWAGPSLVGLAEAELGMNNAQAALNALDRYLQENPQGDFAAQALAAKARAAERQGGPQAATGILQDLMARYAESYEAEQARPRLAAGANAPAPATGETGKYTVQVGAFAKADYAQKLVERLRKKGYNAYILETRQGEEVFSQVRVGHYASREFAQKIGDKLSRSDKLPYLVIPYTPVEKK
ncbi:MAG: outer membrane protein assembly factor BamD [candidate division FCPU426 bacterium]